MRYVLETRAVEYARIQYEGPDLFYISPDELQMYSHASPRVNYLYLAII